MNKDSLRELVQDKQNKNYKLKSSRKVIMKERNGKRIKTKAKEIVKRNLNPAANI